MLMPRNVVDKALPRCAGGTSATAMPAASGVNEAPAPISTRPSSRVRKSVASADTNTPSAKMDKVASTAVRRRQRPTSTSNTGASSAVAKA